MRRFGIFQIREELAQPLYRDSSLANNFSNMENLIKMIRKLKVKNGGAHYQLYNQGIDECLELIKAYGKLYGKKD